MSNNSATDHQPPLKQGGRLRSFCVRFRVRFFSFRLGLVLSKSGRGVWEGTPVVRRRHRWPETAIVVTPHRRRRSRTSRLADLRGRIRPEGLVCSAREVRCAMRCRRMPSSLRTFTNCSPFGIRRIHIICQCRIRYEAYTRNAIILLHFPVV